MKPLILSWVFLMSIFFANAQAPTIEWQQYFGGSGGDSFGSILKLNGGFLVGAGTSSNNGDVSGYHGGDLDSWFVRLDSFGNIIWQKCYGGSLADAGLGNIISTAHGTMIFVGATSSNDGDVSGNHLAGQNDAWIVEIDSTGSIIRQKCFGGTGIDGFYNLLPLSSGGFIACGYSNSIDGDLNAVPFQGVFDTWIIKMDSSWNILWQKRYGGTQSEAAIKILPKSNGGFKIAAGTYSFDGDVTQHYGVSYADIWLLDLDSSGNLLSQRCYGGSFDDFISDMWFGSNGSFYVGAYVKSNDWNVLGNHGYYDYWIFKINSSGNILWQKCFGGSRADYLYSTVVTSDGNFLLSGRTNSSDGDVTGNHFGGGGCAPYACDDIWLVKVDTLGNLIWQKCFGGSGNEGGYSIVEASNGGFLIVGEGESTDGDAAGANYHGNIDGWVLKLSTSFLDIPENPITQIDLTTSPNPDGSISVKFFSKKNGQAVINLTDVLGRSLIHEDIKVQEGFNTVMLSPNRANGIYIVNLIGEIGVGTKKVVMF